MRGWVDRIGANTGEKLTAFRDFTAIVEVRGMYPRVGLSMDQAAPLIQPGSRIGWFCLGLGIHFSLDLFTGKLVTHC